MQLHAIDLKGQVISAGRAVRQTNYACLECGEILRLRAGPYRQPHFYHIEPNPICRQHQKGAIHLQLQTYFFNQLPRGDCLLELSFPSIGRIADVAWLSRKIVFEIQYSAISAGEVLARNEDYRKIDWSVVWILHDERYNQIRTSAAETALRQSPHYFSNMDSQGRGIIYDQFDISGQGLRYGRLPPLPIDIKGAISLPSGEIQSYPLELLNQRAKNWGLSFQGDLMSHHRELGSSAYLNQAIEHEKKFYLHSRSGNFAEFLLKLWRRGIVNPYRIFFHYILEKICR